MCPAVRQHRPQVGQRFAGPVGHGDHDVEDAAAGVEVAADGQGDLDRPFDPDLVGAGHTRPHRPAGLQPGHVGPTVRASPPWATRPRSDPTASDDPLRLAQVAAGLTDQRLGLSVACADGAARSLKTIRHGYQGPVLAAAFGGACGLRLPLDAPASGLGPPGLGRPSTSPST